MRPTPYISPTSPTDGQISVLSTAIITFDFQTDVPLRTLVVATTNIWVDEVQAVANGVFINSYTGSLTPAVNIINVSITPPSNLSLKRILVEGTVEDNTAVLGTDYYEFATTSFDYIVQMMPNIPIPCPYDNIPDPIYVSPATVTLDKVDGTFYSPTTNWAYNNGSVKDVVRVESGSNKGDYIIQNLNLSTVTTYEYPNVDETTVTVSTYKQKIFSQENPVVLVANRAFKYPLIKVWGDTDSRILGGFPSDLDFPIGFRNTPSSSVDPASGPTAANSVFNDYDQKNLEFTIEPDTGKYRRYSLLLNTPIVGLKIGTRSICQFSVSSMEEDAEFYMGLANSVGFPTADGNNRSGVTIKRVIDDIECTVEHGGTTNTAAITIPYAAFINTVWTAETDLVDTGVLTLNLYSSGDFSDPVLTVSSTGGGAVNADRWSLTSDNYDLGEDCVGAVHFVDVEVGPNTTFTDGIIAGSTIFETAGAFVFRESDVGRTVTVTNATNPLDQTVRNIVQYVSPTQVQIDDPFIGSEVARTWVISSQPYTVSTSVPFSEAKFRGFLTSSKLDFTETSGIKLLNSLASLDGTVNSSSVFDNHVFDAEDTLTTIDNVHPLTNQIVYGPLQNRASYAYTYNNGGISFFATALGSAGNNISIEIFRPNAALAAFSIIQTANHVLINLATNGSSLVTTTMQNIVDALEVYPNSIVQALTTGVITETPNSLAPLFLTGGAEYKTSSNTGFNEISLSFRSNKAGIYTISVKITGSDDSLLTADGKLIASSSVFRPSNVGEFVIISGAQNSGNNGTHEILGVFEATENRPGNTIQLDSSFIAENQTFSWEVTPTGIIVANGYYRQATASQTLTFFSSIVNSLSDGARSLNVQICKNSLLESTSQIDLTFTTNASSEVI